MRNIEKYEQLYLEHPFERVLEKYRRDVVKKAISDYAERDSTIMEIGCGIEPLFIDYEDIYSFFVIEPAKNCYENANRIAQSYSRVKCYNGFFEDIVNEIEKREFAVIICSGLLHEVENPRKLLNSIKNLCNKKTVVHINVPNAYSFHRLLAKEMGLIQNVYQFSNANKMLQQQAVFDEQTIKKLVQQEDFQVIDIGTYFLKPFTHKQMQQCLDLNIFDEDVLIGLNRLCESYFQQYGAEIYLNMRLK